MTTTIDIRPLIGEELEEACILLAENFTQDPTIEWMLQKNRDGFCERVKTYMNVVHQFYNAVQMPVLGALLNGNLCGVLYGGYFDDVNTQEAEQHLKNEIKKSFTGELHERIMEYEQSMNDEIQENTYLLGLIAVAKHARGQGIGSALIKHVIATCKKESDIEKIMLDTANIRNIDLYERLGFKSTVIKAFDDNFCQTVMVHSLD